MTHVNRALFCAGFLAFGVAALAGGCDTTSAGCVDDCCGDGIIDTGEDCDDGNLRSGDGCSPTCTWEQCDAPACVNRMSGDSFCDGDQTVGCDMDGRHCMLATTVDCDAGGQVCEDTGGAALCEDPTCDDPECVGSTDGATFCQADVAVTCDISMSGCLIATTLDCNANGEACDDGDGAAVCVCIGCDTWGDTGCSADDQCDTGVCWDFADYDPLCGGSTCSIECVSHSDCQSAFASAGAPNASAAQCGTDGRCDPIGTGFGAFFCQ